MNLTCPHCSTKLNLPDEKIPKDRDSSFKCPKCKGTVQVKAASPAKAPDESFASGGGLGQFRRSTRAQALVCMSPSKTRKRMTAAIRRAGYFVDLPENPDQAFHTLEYNVFPLVIVDDDFDRDGRMTAYMNDMDMSLRRKICLVRISPGVETGNAMAALHASVNFVIRTRDIEQEDDLFIEDIFAAALADHENFYAVFNDSLKAAGKG